MIDRPMKLQWFQILLALSERPLHGHGVQRAVLEATGGHMTLWPAMLYRSIRTLQEAGFIEPAKTPEGQPADERRNYYRLTPAGRERLAEEADMLARWAAAAREATP